MLKGSQQFTGFNDRYRLTVKLNSLAGLLSKVVNNHWLCCHFHDVTLLTQRFFILWFLQFTILQDQTISSTTEGCRELLPPYRPFF
jgi:hypothetical protein